MIIGRWGNVGTALLGAAVGCACTAALSAGPVPVPTAPPLKSSHPCIPSPSADTAPCSVGPIAVAFAQHPPGEVLCTDEDVERWRNFLRDAAGVLDDGSRIRKSWEVSRRKLGGSRDRIMLASERGPERLKVGGGQRLKEPRRTCLYVPFFAKQCCVLVLLR